MSFRSILAAAILSAALPVLATPQPTGLWVNSTRWAGASALFRDDRIAAGHIEGVRLDVN